MKLTVAALVMAVVAMAIWVWSQAASMRQLERTVQQLSMKPSASVTGAGLELQAKCSEQASKVFADMGYAKNPLAGYENHYSSAINKCFIHIQNTDSKVDPGTIWTYRNVFDAFEGKAYGTFAWHTEKGKKYWEVPPFQCEVTLMSAEKKLCQSSDEFTELVKVYMEGR